MSNLIEGFKTFSMRFPFQIFYLVMRKQKRPSIISLVKEIIDYTTYNENGVHMFKIRNMIQMYKERKNWMKLSEKRLVLDGLFVNSVEDIQKLKNINGFQKLFLSKEYKDKLDTLYPDWSEGLEVCLIEDSFNGAVTNEKLVNSK